MSLLGGYVLGEALACDLGGCRSQRRPLAFLRRANAAPVFLTFSNSPFRPMPERKGELSELMLNLLRSQMTLNQRVPGSSPGAPTKHSFETHAPERARRKAAFAALSRDFIQPLLGLCREVSVSGALSAPPSPAAKIPFPAGETGVSVGARSPVSPSKNSVLSRNSC
jgi:hypothetical protein